MLNKPFLLLVILTCIFGKGLAQTIELFSNEECKVAYLIKGSFLHLYIEDLKPKTSCGKDYVRAATVADYTSDNGSIQVEFDKNSDGKFNENDWGVFSAYGSSNIIGYSLYSNYQGLFMHKLNKGFDITTKSKLINSSGSWDGSKPLKYELQVPLKEIANVTSKKINFQIAIYRQLSSKADGFYLEIPKKREEFKNTFEISINSNALIEDAEKERAIINSSKLEFSKTKYLSKPEFDGIYIDMGNGKFAELSITTGENGVIVGANGAKVINYYKDVPFITSLSKTVLIPKCQKIVMKGSDLQGEFLEWLTIHEIENLSELNIKRNHIDFQSKIKVVAYAGKFGSDYSLKSLQPDKLYTPVINKTTLQDWINLEYNTKTINENTIEMKISSPLQKGKTYCLWSGKNYYLFEIQ